MLSTTCGLNSELVGCSSAEVGGGNKRAETNLNDIESGREFMLGSHGLEHLFREMFWKDTEHRVKCQHGLSPCNVSELTG